MVDQPDRSQFGPEGARAYGLVLEFFPDSRRAATRAFLSARIAQRVVRGATISSVPNSHLGMALIGGSVIPVVALGATTSEIVVCELWESLTPGVEPEPAKGATETIGVSGVTVLSSGAFKRLDGASVEFRGEPVEALDVALLVDALE